MELSAGILFLFAILQFFVMVFAIYLGVTRALRSHDTYRENTPARLKKLVAFAGELAADKAQRQQWIDESKERAAAAQAVKAASQHRPRHS